MEFFWIFFSLVLALALYIMGTTLYLSATSTMQTNLPPMQVTPATLQGTSAPVAFCPKCGTAYAQGAAFCAKCGSPKAVRQTWQLPIKGSITAQQAQKQINEFLAQNPYIADCKLDIRYSAILMFPFVQLRFRVKSAQLSFTLAQQPQPWRYGMAFLYKYRLFGSIGYNQQKLVDTWKQNNPRCSVVSHSGSHIQHFSSRGNFEAHFYNYVFFRTPR